MMDGNSSMLPDSAGVAVSVITMAVKLRGIVVPGLPIVEVKLGIGVNILVGKNVGVDEESINNVAVGVVENSGEGF